MKRIPRRIFVAGLGPQEEFKREAIRLVAMHPRTSPNRPVALSVFRAVVPHELSTSANPPPSQIRRTPMPSRPKARQEPAGRPAPVHCRYADQSSLLSSARCDEHLIFDSEQRSVGHRGISRTSRANSYDRQYLLRVETRACFLARL